MPRGFHHRERHLIQRVGWLRAAVLGANDGILSTASLIVGVAESNGPKSALLVAGIAGLVAGAMSMAAGEYVSVSSQSDAEKADLAREAGELRDDPEFERRELARIYEGRGLTPDLATQVADQLMAKDALGAHARDELGISEVMSARPVQAAMASAASFAAGAVLPLIFVLAAPRPSATIIVSLGSLVSLALLGWMGASAGGANALKPAARVVLWGAVAMAVTAGIGRLIGANL